MSTFYLIRHGEHDLLGKVLTGRMPGVSLNERGRAQGEQVAERLASVGITAIYSSPRERAQESAAPLAARLGLPVTITEEIEEFEIGDWTGCSFESRQDDPMWTVFNTFRSRVCPPGGETMLQVQARMVQFAARVAEESPDGRIALFSHGDPLKSLLMHYLGMPLDLFMRIDIDPGSVSILRLEQDWAQVQLVNGFGL